jgi:hypothetical protein
MGNQSTTELPPPLKKEQICKYAYSSVPRFCIIISTFCDGNSEDNSIYCRRRSEEPRSLLSITNEEWIYWQWTEMTTLSDPERIFVRGRRRTPAEMAEEIRNIELIAKYKMDKEK